MEVWNLAYLKWQKYFNFSFLLLLFEIQTRKSQFYDMAIKRIIFHLPPPSYLCSTQNKKTPNFAENFFLHDFFSEFLRHHFRGTNVKL